MGWFGSKKSRNSEGVKPVGIEVVKPVGIRVQENYTYYLGLDGHVWRTDENNTVEMVSTAGVYPTDGF
ncbi:MAG: hypothetical protein CMA55_01595, partial [Euryarchaeota archaeon]|nr:hypothetical protein [Euryarchaeota archaeon]